MALVLFHGWGTNKNIFSALMPRLSAAATAYDLPGHGELADTYLSREDYLARLAPTLKSPVDVLGWSMGGLYAMDLAATYPDLVRSLILVATFPRFYAAADYPCGLKSSVLEKSLATSPADFPRSIEEFLLFQCLGNEEAGRVLRRQIFPRLFMPLNVTNLQKTLKDTLDADLRDKLPHIQQPVLMLFGAKDRVTPPAFAHYLEEHLSAAQLTLLQGSGHLPFFSEEELFTEKVNEFLTACDTEAHS